MDESPWSWPANDPSPTGIPPQGAPVSPMVPVSPPASTTDSSPVASSPPAFEWVPPYPSSIEMPAQPPVLPDREGSVVRAAPDHPRRSRWIVVGAAFLVSAVAAAAFSVGRLAGGDDTVSDVVGTADGSTDVSVANELSIPLATDTSPNDPEPVAAVAAAVLPSVVQIDIRTVLDDPLSAVAQGSGIVIDDTHVVTNAHVVSGTEQVVVRLSTGRDVVADVVGVDVDRDVAVVELAEEADVTPASFAGLDTIEVGQMAVAIGSPFSLDQTVTAGIVSAVGRAVPSQADALVEMIQTDAAINPGNSGGALADREGRVIGMNTSIRTDGATVGNVGVGFAIPADTFLLVAERLLAGESTETGFLGIQGITPTTGEAGALIDCVSVDTPASDAGLEPGDLVVSIDGSPISSMGDLAATIQLHQPGDDIAIDVLRDGREVQLTAVLGDPADRTASTACS